MTTRRAFVASLLGGSATAIVSGSLAAQAAAVQRGPRDAPVAPPQGNTSNLFDMDQDAARTVVRPPKPGATRSMSADDRDALEHQLRCQCGCTLDVYTCRTTDFACKVSPQMHRDVMALVEGGYPAQEILDAFVSTYGERSLMSPRREGFNWAGYLVPFVALGTGAIVMVAVLRRMQRTPVALPAVDPSARSASGSADELARLDAAVRRDD